MNFDDPQLTEELKLRLKQCDSQLAQMRKVIGCISGDREARIQKTFYCMIRATILSDDRITPLLFAAILLADSIEDNEQSLAV